MKKVEDHSMSIIREIENFETLRESLEALNYLQVSYTIEKFYEEGQRSGGIVLEARYRIEIYGDATDVPLKRFG